MALDTLKWPKDECRFVLIGKLSYIVEKAGTSTEQLNTYSGLSSLSSSSTANITAMHNSSSTSKIWSRTLKFSAANAVLVTRVPSTQTTVSNSTTGFEMDHDDTLTSIRSDTDMTDVLDLSRIQLNSIGRRNKAPSRVNSFCMSQTNPNDSGNEAALLLVKEKNGRYILCRVSVNLVNYQQTNSIHP